MFLRTSNSYTSDPDYYNEHGDPIHAHLVNVQDNKHKHLIQFPDQYRIRESQELSGKFHKQWKVSYYSTKG